MRFELWIFFIVVFFMYDTYYDNKYTKMIFTYKKHFQIIMIGIGGLLIYYIIKKSPENCKNLIFSANDYLRYIPIDKNTKEMMSPIIDLTTSTLKNNNFNYENTIVTPQEKRMMNSGLITTSNKRVVSETKKKYVASKNNWKCANCKNMLTHTFEIDHKISLKNGGDNSIENLIPLCRTCHGDKTSFENMK